MKASKRRAASPALALLPVLLLAPPAAGHPARPDGEGGVRAVQAVRAQGGIQLDGRLDDAVWQQAPPVGDFRQRDPEEGQPATEGTELRVAYDDDALYVGVRLLDREPQGIVRRLSRRDDVAEADSFTVYLDPYFDHTTGVVFQVSAAGVQRDAVIFNDSWTDDTWDGVWQSAVDVAASGWSAELRIPLSELRFDGGGRTWGINASRRLQRRNEETWLELVPKQESGLASRMAHLEGLADLKPRRSLALQPYASVRAELVEPEPGDPFGDPRRVAGGLGLDLKYRVASNLTLAGTVNPDFGQVEVDPAVVNLSDFETFFPERRPFFVEGAQIFDGFGRSGANDFWGFNRSEPELFYSRRIGRAPQGSTDGDFELRPAATTILGAGKLAGRSGGWTLAALDAVTGSEWAQVASGGERARQQVEPLTNYLAARAYRERPNAAFGFLATAVNRDLSASGLEAELARGAYVFGVDGYRFLGAARDWVVTGRVAGSRLSGSRAAIEEAQRASQRYFQRPDASHVRVDPEATSLSGWTGSLNLNRNNGRLRANAALWATSPGFESDDLGFNWRSDRWGAHLVGSWRKTEPDAVTRNRFLAVAKWYTWNFAGERQADGAGAFLNAQLRNYWRVGANLFKTWQSFDDRLTRGGPTALRPAAYEAGGFLESDSRRPLTLRLDSGYGADAAGGRHLWGEIGLGLKAGGQLSLSLGPSLRLAESPAQWVDAFEDPAAASTYGARYVFASLDQTEVGLVLRANLVVSPRLSLQLYAQPLVSVGEYTGFKELARPRSYDFVRYGTDAGAIAYDPLSGRYRVLPGAGGQPFAFDNPDFNYKSLRVNAVLRWEYRPGSTLYVVWTQSRENEAYPGQFDLERDTAALWNAPADDVFMVKLAYRFSR